MHTSHEIHVRGATVATLIFFLLCKHYPSWLSSLPFTQSLSLCPSPELEEMLHALRWAKQCLTDTQSQQDVALVLQLLTKEEFRTAHSVHSAISRQMSRAGPTTPLTAQAHGLCQEVGPNSQYPIPSTLV